jgi:hypothetical protein
MVAAKVSAAAVLTLHPRPILFTTPIGLLTVSSSRLLHVPRLVRAR